MAANICDQIQSGNYKTVRLLDGRIRLFSGDQSYTFTEGNIKSAQIDKISSLSPFDLSSIDECFVNNGKVYYIRQNKAYVYEGQNVSSFSWNPYNSNIARMIIKRNGKIIGFMVLPNSQNSGNNGQSIAQSNDIQVMAYGGGSVSISSFNGNFQIIYNGWSVPSMFNAFMANSDNSVTFFNGNKYCLTKQNSNSACNWKDVNTFFGC